MNYPSYSQSISLDAKWLGSVPTHWQIRRLKYCVNLINQKLDTLPKGYKYFGLENIESQTGYVFPPNEDVIPEGACNYFSKGDVLFGKLRPYLAKVMLAEENGGCTTELLVLRPHLVNAKFLLYYLLADGFIKIVDSSTYGAKMPRANWDFIGNLLMLIPSFDEQRKIVDFLDTKTPQIDALITEKEQQIELLGIKRQAIISHAVMEGIDPNVPLKSSGTKWFGNIPMHWEIARIKYLSQKIGSGKTPRGGAEIYLDDGVIFLRSQNVYDDGLHLEDVVHISDEIDEELANTRIQSLDVLLNITGASIGRTCVVPDDFPRANVNQHVCIIRPRKDEIEPLFLAYCLKAASIKGQIMSLENGSSRQGLNFEQISNLVIVLPRKNKNEQRAIVDYLNTETKKIEEVSQSIGEQIELLKKLRQVLITESVTGKINVQGVTL